MEQTHIAMVGVGWRAEFFLRVAAALPDRFIVDGAVVRNAEKGAIVQARWGIPTFRDLDALLSHCSPTYVITCVPWAANPALVVELVERGLPVLSETPPAPDLAGLCDLWDRIGATGLVQVSEQYIFQPHHAARLAIARSGKLGAVSQVQVSAAHGYHGVSLLRHYLDVDMDVVSIRARAFTSPLVARPDRNGPLGDAAVRHSQ